jgi:hypothetical protein
MRKLILAPMALACLIGSAVAQQAPTSTADQGMWNCMTTRHRLFGVPPDCAWRSAPNPSTVTVFL